MCGRNKKRLYQIKLQHLLCIKHGGGNNLMVWGTRFTSEFAPGGLIDAATTEKWDLA